MQIFTLHMEIFLQHDSVSIIHVLNHKNFETLIDCLLST